jgi:hypothetical protein
MNYLVPKERKGRRDSANFLPLLIYLKAELLNLPVYVNCEVISPYFTLEEIYA